MKRELQNAEPLLTVYMEVRFMSHQHNSLCGKGDCSPNRNATELKDLDLR